MIPPSKPYLPDKQKYFKYVEKIYDTKQLTNNGPLVRELESRLKKYLGVKNIVLISNGTLALELSYKALGIKKQAITTPFSFVATVSSLVFNDIKPKFVDINSKTFNIDEKNIEKAISKNIEAIVPVHVFGNACEVEEINNIAKKHNIKVIYDAAHAFGTSYMGKSILNYGDISTLSFHATKVFHTIEGGAIITNNNELAKKIKYMISFGIDENNDISSLGVNAKMNEFQAAMGLCLLDNIDFIMEKRSEIWESYRKEFDGYVEFQERNKKATNNFSYFPILLKDEKELLKIQKKLNNENIHPRRYFYPSLDTLNYIKTRKPMINSQNISEKILCLPIYPDLDKKVQNNIIKIVIDCLK